jgi:nitrite reductase/ring-hydroxylating ferredoxin subunit
VEPEEIGTDWTSVLAAAELRQGKPTTVAVGGADVLLYRLQDRMFAIGNHCTHQGAPLHRGRVKSFGEILAVTCPAHGSMFRLNDGTVMRGPATSAVPVYEARMAGDSVEIRRRSH